MKFLLLITAGFIFGQLCAQDATPIDPTVALCKPGVKHKAPGKGLQITYGWNTSNQLGTAVVPALQKISDVRDIDRLKVKLKIPVLNRDGLKFLLGLEHFREGYQLTSRDLNKSIAIETFEQRILKSSKISAYLIKSLDEKNYLAFQTQVRFNGDYAGLIDFDHRYSAYRLGAVWGRKVNARKEFGFGLAASIRPDRWAIFPFLNYNQTFNARWGIEATLPVKIALRRNFDDRNIALLGVNFARRDFVVDALGTPVNRVADAYVLDRQEINCFVDFQTNVSSWVWLQMKVGYQFNTQMEFFLRSARETNFFPAKPLGGAFVNFGIFLAPPKKFYK